MLPFKGKSNAIWPLACIIAIIGSAVYWHISQPEGGLLWDFKTGYYAAGDAVWHNGSAALWPLTEQRWFVNLPIIAWLFAPLAALGPRGAAIAFNLLGLLAILASFAIVARWCSPRVRPIVFLLFALNGPLWYSLLIGNTTHFILLLLVSALVLWEKRRLLMTGIILGLAAVVKPLLLLFGIYFAWTRNWRVVIGGTLVIALSLISTILVFGHEFFLGWYQQVVVAFAGKPMGAHNVQSLDAFLLRLKFGPELLFNFNPQVLPTTLGLIRNALVGCVFLAIVWALWLNRRQRGKPLLKSPLGIDYLEFCLMLTFCVTTSTVSWTHYYLLLIVPWSLYLAGKLPLRDDNLTHRLVWGSIVLCSLPFSYPRLTSGLTAEILSRTIQSIWFLGGLLLLWALLRSAIDRNDKDVELYVPLQSNDVSADVSSSQ